MMFPKFGNTVLDSGLIPHPQTKMFLDKDKIINLV